MGSTRMSAEGIVGLSHPSQASILLFHSSLAVAEAFGAGPSLDLVQLNSDSRGWFRRH